MKDEKPEESSYPRTPSDQDLLAARPKSRIHSHWIFVGMVALGAFLSSRAQFDEIQGFFFWTMLSGTALFLFGVREYLQSRTAKVKSATKVFIGLGLFVALFGGLYFWVFWPRLDIGSREPSRADLRTAELELGRRP